MKHLNQKLVSAPTNNPWQELKKSFCFGFLWIPRKIERQNFLLVQYGKIPVHCSVFSLGVAKQTKPNFSMQTFFRKLARVYCINNAWKQRKSLICVICCYLLTMSVVKVVENKARDTKLKTICTSFFQKIRPSTFIPTSTFSDLATFVPPPSYSN